MCPSFIRVFSPYKIVSSSEPTFLLQRPVFQKVKGSPLSVEKLCRRRLSLVPPVVSTTVVEVQGLSGTLGLLWLLLP